MREPAKITKRNIFKLTNKLVGTSDLSHVIRELEKLDDFLYQAGIRKPGTPVNPQRSSTALNELCELNNLSLLNHKARKQLIDKLDNLEREAPVIHISFAVEPSASFMEKITAWTRQNIHPHLLVDVGLQPSVAVGCLVRTTNKIFDMSLRNRFAENRKVLIDELEKTQ